MYNLDSLSPMTLSSMHRLALLICLLCASVVSAISCPRGTFKDTTTRIGPTRCVKCLPGYYSAIVNATACTPCPAGSYTPFRGVRLRHLCLPCRTNEISDRGSSTCRPCPRAHVSCVHGGKASCVRCPAGSFINPYGCKCEKCPEDSISALPNSFQCTRCRNSWQWPQQPKRTRCLTSACKPGFYHDGYGYCEPCNYNTFRNSSMKVCQECPFGTATNNFNGPNARCERCPPGSYLTDYAPQTTTFEQVTYCAKCPEGWTTLGFGKTLCHKSGTSPAKRCPANSFVDEDGDCQVCGVNYRVDLARKRCVKCPTGQVSSGGVQTRCDRCPGAGQRASGEGVVSLGFSGTCECPHGTELVSARGEQPRCRKCLRGTVPISLSGGCIKCPYDQTTRLVNGIRTCVPCPPGKIITTTAAGKICVKPKQCAKSGFIPAPPGRPRFFRPGVCVSGVTGCPIGARPAWRGRNMLCENVRTRKIVCPSADTHAFDGRSKCVSCGVNQFLKRNSDGVLSCVRCRENEVSRGGRVTACSKCLNGFKRVYTRGRCVCPIGWYVKKNRRCVRCKNGTWNDKANARSCKKCDEDKGFVLTTPSGNGRRRCVCPKGRVVTVGGRCVKDEFEGPKYTTA